MPIRTLKTPLPPECKRLWQELGEVIGLCEGQIRTGEMAGKDMSHEKELCTMFTDRFVQIGMQYYPEDLLSIMPTAEGK